jgi:hypothetical protein
MKEIILSTLIISSSIFALDSTRVPQNYNFIPSSDTQAKRATMAVEAMKSDVTTIGDIARESVGIAKGTRATLVNKEGCVYNSRFDCTEANLTHQYTSKSWTTPGSYSWIVPAGITNVYVVVRGGQGGAGGSARVSCRGSTNGWSGSAGSSSYFAGIASAGGAGGAGGRAYHFSCGDTPIQTGARSGGMAWENHQTITTTPGNTINVVVGRGGAGGQSWRGVNGSNGSSGSVKVQF